MNRNTVVLILFALLIPVCLANPLPYWIENDSGNLTIWTKVNISAGGTICLVIKKEPGYAPDGNKVFEFFDDFDGTALNTSKWVVGSGTWTVSNSEISTTNTKAYIYTLNSISLSNYIVESRMYVDSSELFNMYFGCDNSGNGYMGRIDTRSSYYDEILKVTGWTSWADLYKGSYPSSVGYHIMKIIVDDSNATLYIDGNLISSGSITVNNPFKIGFQSDGVTVLDKVDWVLVRKYAGQEPTVSVEQISTDTWKVTITNPNNYDLIDFQVEIPGTGIVSSKTDSLMIIPVPIAQIDYYKSIGGYTLTVSGDLGNISIYLGSTLLYTGNITSDNPYQTTFSYDVSSYTLNIVYHDYGNVSVPYQISPITQGTYTLTLVPVGNYTNESYYPLIITVAGRSYWISNYSNIPINVSITAYEDTPITITTLLGQVITVPAKNQKVPIYFTNPWSNIQASTTPGHIIEFKTQEGYTVGYGEQINIKVPTGLVLTPYIDGYPLPPITVSQDLNLFYNPSNYIPHVSIYQTMDGKIIVSIQSSQPHNFTIMFYNSSGIVKNISVFPGTWTYNNENYTKVAVYVDGREYASLNLYTPTLLQDWSTLDFPTKVLLSMFLMMICALIYLTSGITMVLAAGIALPLLILLPIPTQLIGIISAFMLLSALFYLYKKRM